MLKIKRNKKLMIPIIAMILVVAMAGSALALPNPQVSSFPLISKVNNQGAYNGYVLFAQRVLYDFSYTNCAPDGLFGSITDQRVKDYQRAYGLSRDGIVGSNTWSVMAGELSLVSWGHYLGSVSAYNPYDPYRYTIYNLSNGEGWWVLHQNNTYQGIN